MSVKIKSVMKRNPLQPGSKPKYYPSVVSNGEYTIKQLAKRVAEMSSFAEGDVLGILQTILQAIPEALSDGKIVRLGDLGSLRISIKAEGIEDEKKVTINQIKSTSVIFSPGKDLKAAVSRVQFEKE